MTPTEEEVRTISSDMLDRLRLHALSNREARQLADLIESQQRAYLTLSERVAEVERERDALREALAGMVNEVETNHWTTRARAALTPTLE